MSYIEVNQISKTFKVAKKKSGLKEAFKSFFKREYLYVEAIKDASFEIDKGEIVAYIGPNGAGKSTLYQTIENLKDMPRVNVDEIVRKIGSWKNSKDVYIAGKKAVKEIAQYFEEGVTFNQETTLCGQTIINNILKAKELGYFIEVHYVGVNSVEIAKERVKYREAHGGHGIPESDIEKRYVETFMQLNTVLKECNLIAFYDNTESFR